MKFPTVFVTGLGIVSSIGIGRERFFAGLRDDGSRTGSIENFRIEDYLDSEKTYLDRCSAFALAACALALKDSEQPTVSGDQLPDTTHRSPTGICLGTACGCLHTMEDFFRRVLDKGPRFANSLLFSHSYANSPTSLAAIEFGLSGYHSTVTAGSLSGVLALMQAVDAIRLGYADRMLAGGVDVISDPLTRVWTELHCNRVPGEGAAFFLLENENSFRQRGMIPDRSLRISVEWIRKDNGPTPSSTFDLESRIGYALGASGVLDIAAAVAKLDSGESNRATVVSKDSQGCMETIIEKVGVE